LVRVLICQVKSHGFKSRFPRNKMFIVSFKYNIKNFLVKVINKVLYILSIFIYNIKSEILAIRINIFFNLPVIKKLEYFFEIVNSDKKYIINNINKSFIYLKKNFKNYIEYINIMKNFGILKDFFNYIIKKSYNPRFFYKFGAILILKSSFKTSFLFLYSPDLKLIKQWSVKMFPKLERRRNTKYNIQKMVYSLNSFLKLNNYRYIHLILKGKGLGRYNFLKSFDRRIKILSIEEKSSIPFGGCRSQKKPRK
jgi:ribosomal protein S11